MIAAHPAKEDLDVCGDCGARAEHGSIMIPLRKPGGWWAVCSVCWRRSAREAEQARVERTARLAALEGKTRKTHRKPKVGSHQDELPEYIDEILSWNEGAA